MSHTDFNKIKDLRLYFLHHPDSEMVLQSCLHFLGDDMQHYYYRHVVAKEAIKVGGFQRPFRLGRKQKRVILDAKGQEVIMFPKGAKGQGDAIDFLNFLNR